MTITLLVIAAASIALNVFQFMERRGERKETMALVGDHALLVQEHEKLTDVYNNERLHKEWAIGRIKDQQSVIDRLKAITPTPAKARKTFKPKTTC